MTPKREYWGVNVQVVGQFNPRLFLPAWFSEVGLLREEEAGAATIQIVHEDIAQFALEWMHLQVTKDRLIAATTRLDQSEVLRDVVAGALGLLTHTPTSIIGINHDFWLTFADDATWNKFGYTIVPQSSWTALSDAGMVDSTVQGIRDDDREGFIRVTLEPELTGSRRCRVMVNDHYEVSEVPKSSSTPEIVKILETNWAASAQRSEAISKSLQGLV